MNDGTEELICAAVENVEEIRDPLDGLVARTEVDRGAPFAPAVLERLVALRNEDRAQFERLRAQLKRVGCRVTGLDEALAEEAGEESGRGPKQADLLIELAQEVELFHAPDDTAFADLQVNGHRETWKWTGTASDLLGALNEQVSEKVRKAKTWPSSSRALSGRVRRAATFLRNVGIDIAFEREGHARTRTIQITLKPENTWAEPSHPSATSTDSSKPAVGNGFRHDDARTVSNQTDANAGCPGTPTVCNDHRQDNDMDDADGADANAPAQSMGGSTRP